jgi:hypothetical protein
MSIFAIAIAKIDIRIKKYPFCLKGQLKGADPKVRKMTFLNYFSLPSSKVIFYLSFIFCEANNKR